MSLMNDALRKKKREATESPVSQGFIEVSAQPWLTRRWLVVPAGLILLTFAVFYGNHLLQTGAGRPLPAMAHRPERSLPPVDHTGEKTPDVHNQSDGHPRPASAGRQIETLATGDPTEGNRLATAGVNPAQPSPAVHGNLPDTRAGETAPALQPAENKTDVEPAARTAPSTEAPVQTDQGKASARLRTFEPGPVPTGSSEKSRAAASRQPPASVKPLPSPAPNQSSRTKGKVNTGAAVRKNAPTGAEEDLFYNKARAYHRNGRLAEAIRLYRQVLKAHSNHPGAMLNLAAAYMQQGNYIEATLLLQRLEQWSPRPQGVLLNMAMAAIGMGAPEKALEHLNRASALSDATPWEIRFHRAVAFARMNRLPEALDLYREAEKERPGDPRLQFNLAVTCDALGYYPEAVSRYEAVLRISPGSSETDHETITQRIRTLRRYLDTAQSPATGR